MSLRDEQCKKVCRILDDVLANRPTERDALILAVRTAFDRLNEGKTGYWIEYNPQNSPDCRLIKCSECEDTYIVGFNIDYDDWINGRNYCSNCGARLESDKEGAQE